VGLVAEFGSLEPICSMVTLVLLPGMDGTGELFSKFIETLAPGTESIVVRYPTTGALGYAELERIARSKLPTDRPFVILAESFSGPIGILLAPSVRIVAASGRRHSDRVRVDRVDAQRVRIRGQHRC